MFDDFTGTLDRRWVQTCIGGGSLLTALWLLRQYWHARELTLFVVLGVIAFELVEWVTIGFQPLEAIVGVLALLMFALAW